ncbi:MAG: formylmethanofuran dehydrogenase subunit C [Methylococcaceae bacterium]
MSALTFTLKIELKQRLDVSPLTPDRLHGVAPEAMAALPLAYGNRTLTTAEAFLIEGDDTDDIMFRNGSAKLDFLGRGMSRGRISVCGDAGSYLAMQMTGGDIVVEGRVDAYAACEMKNGAVSILGDAGDFLGAALPGNKKGMAGGVVLVKGNAGDRVGDHQRRGLILIEGNAGAYLGSRMTAGTILVLGQVGDHCGYAMGRGSVLLAQAPARISPTFSDCGVHTLGFIPLLIKSIAHMDTPIASMSDTLKRVHRYAGDLCSLGKGEILIADVVSKR